MLFDESFSYRPYKGLRKWPGPEPVDMMGAEEHLFTSMRHLRVEDEDIPCSFHTQPTHLLLVTVVDTFSC